MEGLCAIFLNDELVTAESDPETYRQLTSFWAAQNNLNPPIILIPRDVASLSKAVKYLYSSRLDFGIRGQGYMSAPTRDVLISLKAFNEFTFNDRDKTVTVGAGQPWSAVYEKLEENAPDYTGVALIPTGLLISLPEYKVLVCIH